MDLVEMIKQRHRKEKQPIEPPPLAGLDSSALVSEQKAEVLLIYAGIENRHYRGRLDVSKSKAELINWLGISYCKTDPTSYQISIVVEPFFMKRNGKYYHFTEAVLGTDIQLRDDKVQVVEPARVFNIPYNHPFVRPDGRICYGELDWVNDAGICFNHFYSLSNMRHVGRGIAHVLARGRMTLEAGYIGDRVIPVHKIEEFLPIAKRLEDAENYASIFGIKRERIIDNDG